MITGYYDQAPLDEYGMCIFSKSILESHDCIRWILTCNLKFYLITSGLVREPKWGHLKELHVAIKLCSRPLLTGTQNVIPLGQLQEVRIYVSV